METHRLELAALASPGGPSSARTMSESPTDQAENPITISSDHPRSRANPLWPPWDISWPAELFWSKHHAPTPCHRPFPKVQVPAPPHHMGKPRLGHIRRGDSGPRVTCPQRPPSSSQPLGRVLPSCGMAGSRRGGIEGALWRGSFLLWVVVPFFLTVAQL